MVLMGSYRWCQENGWALPRPCTKSSKLLKNKPGGCASVAFGQKCLMHYPVNHNSNTMTVWPYHWPGGEGRGGGGERERERGGIKVPVYQKCCFRVNFHPRTQNRIHPKSSHLPLSFSRKKKRKRKRKKKKKQTLFRKIK